MAYAQYGIEVTKNKFELFGDDEEEDPIEVLKKKEEEKETKKKTKVIEKDVKIKEPIVKPKPATARKGIKDIQNVKTVTIAPEPPKPREDESRKKIGNRENSEKRFGNENRDDKFEGRKDGEFRREGGRRGGGRGAGGGGRGGFGGRGPRESRDRNMEKSEPKPAETDDWDEVVEEPVVEAPSLEVEPVDKPEIPAPEVVPEPPAENGDHKVTAEPVEMTLDEWKACRRPKQKPVYNLRKAGEGEDPTQWKKMYALQKKKEADENEEEEEEEYEVCEYPQRVGRQKHVLGIDIHFKDNRTGRGRGGRFGTRGAGHAASGPPTSGPRPVPNVLDEHDFPSFGPH